MLQKCRLRGRGRLRGVLCFRQQGRKQFRGIAAQCYFGKHMGRFRVGADGCKEALCIFTGILRGSFVRFFHFAEYFD